MNIDDADVVLLVCYDCGVKHGRRVPGLSTWHQGECCVCGQLKSVTEPRDFGGHLVHGCRSKTLQQIVAMSKPEP